MNVYREITNLLDQGNIPHRSLEHPPVTSSAQAAAVRGTSPDQGAKALICFADTRPVMIVLSGSRKLDTKAFKTTFGFKNVRFVSPDELLALTGLVPGAVPPFGSLFSLPVYLDKSLTLINEIAFNAGDLTRSIVMHTADYIKIESPTLGNFAV